jgi:uncharacterized protein
MNTTKPTPQRTCVICRTIGSKRGLLRVVRTPEGGVLIDPSGRKPGRGAYVCREVSCLKAIFNGNQIEHVLKVKINTEDKEHLKNDLADFIKEQAVV